MNTVTIDIRITITLPEGASLNVDTVKAEALPVVTEAVKEAAINGLLPPFPVNGKCDIHCCDKEKQPDGRVYCRLCQGEAIRLGKLKKDAAKYVVATVDSPPKCEKCRRPMTLRRTGTWFCSPCLGDAIREGKSQARPEAPVKPLRDNTICGKCGQSRVKGRNGYLYCPVCFGERRKGQAERKDAEYEQPNKPVGAFADAQGAIGSNGPNFKHPGLLNVIKGAIGAPAISRDGHFSVVVLDDKLHAAVRSIPGCETVCCVSKTGDKWHMFPPSGGAGVPVC